jgi:NitT/TauT family transport system ATP-binding protein
VIVTAVTAETPRPDGTPGAATPTVTGAPPAVRLHEVSKAYGRGRDAIVALDRVSLSVAEGEFVCRVGASGCGKSTLLSIVAGLDAASAGTVDVGGRRVGLMFQEAGLFPWLTVVDNVALALELLARVHLDGFADRRPHELSGGMRQRVSLARALAQEADVLLMDEPFGALDAITRDLLHEELERVWSASALTVLFVTHNVREAVRLGDRVLLLSSRPGRVRAQFDVDLVRPRAIDTPEVARLASEITVQLREEVRRHGR